MKKEFSFGTQVRKSPYFDATVRWGAQGFSVYNHMYIPRDFGNPEENWFPWLKTELADILAQLPELDQELSPEENRTLWESWQKGLTHKVPLPAKLPPLRCLLVWDNLKGHKSVAMVEWLVNHGVMPLYTPLGGSWLNMAESIQRIIKRRALDGQHPTRPEEIIDWIEATARGWNANPTPFEWDGKRQARRQRARARRRLHRLGGSGACTTHPILRSDTPLKERRCA